MPDIQRLGAVFGEYTGISRGFQSVPQNGDLIKT